MITRISLAKHRYTKPKFRNGTSSQPIQRVATQPQILCTERSVVNQSFATLLSSGFGVPRMHPDPHCGCNSNAKMHKILFTVVGYPLHHDGGGRKRNENEKSLFLFISLRLNQTFLVKQGLRNSFPFSRIHLFPTKKNSLSFSNLKSTRRLVRRLLPHLVPMTIGHPECNVRSSNCPFRCMLCQKTASR